MNKYVQGQVRHPDIAHEGEEGESVRYYDKSVKSKQFYKALSLAEERYKNPPDYHLFDYNCTKFAKEILEVAGRFFPGKGVMPALGYSPGQLFSALDQRKGTTAKGKAVHEDDPLANIVDEVRKQLDARIGDDDTEELTNDSDSREESLDSSDESVAYKPPVRLPPKFWGASPVPAKMFSRKFDVIFDEDMLTPDDWFALSDEQIELLVDDINSQV